MLFSYEMRSYKGPVAGQLKLPQQFLRFARNLSYKTRRLVGQASTKCANLGLFRHLCPTLMSIGDCVIQP